LRPTLAYLDTNVYQNLYEGTLPKNDLIFLKRCVQERELRVFLSDHVVHELAAISDAEKSLGICELARRLCPDNRWRGGAGEVLARDIQSYARFPRSRICVRVPPMSLPADVDREVMRADRERADLPPAENPDLLDWLICMLRLLGKLGARELAVLQAPPFGERSAVTASRRCGERFRDGSRRSSASAHTTAPSSVDPRPRNAVTHWSGSAMHSRRCAARNVVAPQTRYEE